MNFSLVGSSFKKRAFMFALGGSCRFTPSTQLHIVLNYLKLFSLVIISMCILCTSLYSSTLFHSHADFDRFFKRLSTVVIALGGNPYYLKHLAKQRNYKFSLTDNLVKAQQCTTNMKFGFYWVTISPSDNPFINRPWLLLDFFSDLQNTAHLKTASFMYAFEVKSTFSNPHVHLAYSARSSKHSMEYARLIEKIKSWRGNSLLPDWKFPSYKRRKGGAFDFKHFHKKYWTQKFKYLTTLKEHNPSGIDLKSARAFRDQHQIPHLFKSWK